MKKILLSTFMAFSTMTLMPQTAAAEGVFNGSVANPFVFCSLPKPCKKWCQPWRSIWERICPAGQTNAQEKAMNAEGMRELAKTDPALAQNYMTAEKFRQELGKASLSAFSEDDQYIKEVADWIKYQGNQVVNGKKVVVTWCEQGIANPLGNSMLRQAAYADIVKNNQEIVKTISNGYMPRKGIKPWYDYNGSLSYTCNINQGGN